MFLIFFPCTVLFSRNIHDDSMPNIVLRVTANIVFGYATYVLLSLHMASSVYTQALYRIFLLLKKIKHLTCFPCGYEGAKTLRPSSWAPAASPTECLSSFWRSGCLTTRRSPWCWTESQKVRPWRIRPEASLPVRYFKWVWSRWFSDVLMVCETNDFQSQAAKNWLTLRLFKSTLHFQITFYIYFFL